MKETGILNRDLAKFLAAQGHQDSMMVCDAGFAIPDSIPVVDLSLKKDVPLIDQVLEELARHYSVEKIVMAEETKNISPGKYEKVREILGSNLEVETIPHARLKEMSHDVKFAIRTGDFTAYSNVLLISGAGDRWYLENPDG
jgi:D-ribose pyranase